MIELKDFILEKLSLPRVRIHKESAKKKVILCVIHDKIIHKYLYREGLHLNSVVFPFSLKVFCLVFGEIDFRLKLKTKGKALNLFAQKIQQKAVIK